MVARTYASIYAVLIFLILWPARRTWAHSGTGLVLRAPAFLWSVFWIIQPVHILFCCLFSSPVKQCPVRKNCLSPAENEMSSPAGAPPDPGDGFYPHISCGAGESLGHPRWVLDRCLRVSTQWSMMMLAVAILRTVGDVVSPVIISECSHQWLFIAILIKCELQSPLGVAAPAWFAQSRKRSHVLWLTC